MELIESNAREYKFIFSIDEYDEIVSSLLDSSLYWSKKAKERKITPKEKETRETIASIKLNICKEMQDIRDTIIDNSTHPIMEEGSKY